MAQNKGGQNHNAMEGVEEVGVNMCQDEKGQTCNHSSVHLDYAYKASPNVLHSLDVCERCNVVTTVGESEKPLEKWMTINQERLSYITLPPQISCKQKFQELLTLLQGIGTARGTLSFGERPEIKPEPAPVARQKTEMPSYVSPYSALRVRAVPTNPSPFANFNP